MKFGKELERLGIPEWKSQYVRYEELKDIIDVLAAMDNPPDVEQCPFIKALTKMVKRVNTFYKSQESLLANTWVGLTASLELLEVNEKDDDDDDGDSSSDLRRRQKKKNKGGKRRRWSVFAPRDDSEDVKASVEEFYLALDKLASYKQLNETAIKKILKKYDKNLKRSVSKDLLAKFYAQPCFTSSTVTDLESEVVNAYTVYFTENSRRDAMSRLRVPYQRFSTCPWHILCAGILLGIAAMCIVALGIALSHSDKIDIARSRRVALFLIFRGLFVMALYPLLLSADFYVFAKMGINFRLMMKMSQRDKKAFRLWETLLLAGAFTLAVWGLMSVASALDPYAGSNTASWAPVVTFVCIILAAINPVSVYQRKALPTPFVLLGRIISAPFYAVQFADFWAADQLTSLVRPMLDVEFAIYFYICAYDAADDDDHHLSLGHKVLRGFLASGPYLWRLLQCIRRYRDMPKRSFHPHLTNGLKYTSTFFVIWFSLAASHFKGDDDEELSPNTAKAFFALWILAAIVNMCFTLVWDFWMDWGILRSTKVLLRDKIMFPPEIYYVAIFYNVLGRVAWVLTVSVGFFNGYRYDVLGFGLSIVEILRRSSWNLFRFEIEHLFNCGKLRTTTLEFFQAEAEETGSKSKTHSSRGVVDELSFPGVEGPDHTADIVDDEHDTIVNGEKNTNGDTLVLSPMNHSIHSEDDTHYVAESKV